MADETQEFSEQAVTEFRVKFARVVEALKSSPKPPMEVTKLTDLNDLKGEHMALWERTVSFLRHIYEVPKENYDLPKLVEDAKQIRQLIEKARKNDGKKSDARAAFMSLVNNSLNLYLDTAENFAKGKLDTAKASDLLDEDKEFITPEFFTP